MTIRLKKTAPGQNLMTDVFLLRENPFRQAQTYNPDHYNTDQPGTYVPEMFGDQLDEFYQRFFVRPLQNDTNKQVIGAIWSSHARGAMGKGFGKSVLMGEETKRVNRDFGATLLTRVGAVEEDIVENPFLAGYCTFDQAKDIKSFPAALLDAVAFILESEYGESSTVHLELRRRILERVEAEEGYEGEAIEQALQQELRKYRGLNFQLTHKQLDAFIKRLASGNTPELIWFIRNTIGKRIKAAEGFNFVHIFNAFVRVAGIVYVAYFVDQIENFARFVRNGDRDVKILRESICQTSPTSDMASFVFQMHGRAMEAIEDWWMNEHLPSLDFSKKLNQPRIINLKGLQSLEEAVKLAERYLLDKRLPHAKPPHSLHPFQEEVIEAVFKATNSNPRDFLRTLGSILDTAITEERRRIDLAFIQPLLEDEGEIETEPMDDDFSNPER
jgi:hypothetical protein